MCTSYLINEKYIYLGSFDIESGQIVVSDPSYEFEKEKKSAWNLNKFIPNAKKGKWNAWVYQHEYKKGGKRNARLYAIHSSIINKDQIPDNIKNNKWEKNTGVNASQITDLGVDTGQMTISDLKHYRKDTDVTTQKVADFIDFDPKDPAGEKWYAMICSTNDFHNPSNGGIIPFGVTSSSGWGDGMYKLYSITDKNKEVTGLEIIFIEDGEVGCYENEIKKTVKNDNYFGKYIKYKKKYLNLKNGKKELTLL